jgi:hypothetical protein
MLSDACYDLTHIFCLCKLADVENKLECFYYQTLQLTILARMNKISYSVISIRLYSFSLIFLTTHQFFPNKTGELTVLARVRVHIGNTSFSS